METRRTTAKIKIFHILLSEMMITMLIIVVVNGLGRSNLYQKLMDDASCTNNALPVTFTMPFTVTIVVNVGELGVFKFREFSPPKNASCVLDNYSKHNP